MAYDISEFTKRAHEIETWLQKEFNGIRTGRATPTLIDSIQVEAYGTRVPIAQVGSIGIEDARTLRIACWDTGQIKNVERAIIDADLGVSVSIDDQGLRVSFPELTTERRSQMQKIAKSRYEEARVSLRAARDDIMKDVDTSYKDGDLSEDERFRVKENVQNAVDAANKKLDALLEGKEKEITE